MMKHDQTISEVIFYRTLAIITEIGLQNPISLIDDFDEQFSIKNIGEHLLLEFHLEIRDDVDEMEFANEFGEAMRHYNRISSIKADFYDIVGYPGPVKNWHHLL